MIVQVYNYDWAGVETPAGSRELADVITDKVERHKAISYLTDWGRYWVGSGETLLTLGKYR